MKDNCSDKGDCRRFESLIQKHLDGDITEKERSLLEAHLAHCPHCREELAGYEAVGSLLSDLSEDPEEVPDGLFESLGAQLEEVQPARWLASLLAHPFLIRYRAPALAMASLVLVCALGFGVGLGVIGRADDLGSDRLGAAGGRGVIQTNGGQTFMVFGDEGDAEEYAADLDELERAYMEALESDEESDDGGYIYTRWSGGESASPIR